MSQHSSSDTPRSRRTLNWVALGGFALIIAAISILLLAGKTADAVHPIGVLPQSEVEPPQSAESPVMPWNENECVVSFVGGAAPSPSITLEKDKLYSDLPTPTNPGQIFAGWYRSEEAASSLNTAERINGARLVECPSGHETLHAAWVTPERVNDEKASIPILMYHQFTDKPEGEDNWLRDNYMYIGDFEAHLQYIKEGNFYFPTWPELSAFLDGNLFLPSHSLIITDDDADPTWVTMAAPLVEKYQVPVTSFVIGVDGPGPELSQWVWKRSHTYDMHSAGEDGQGRMVNWGAEAIAEDLQKSADVVGGVKEVVAYPFGHHNDTTHEGLSLAGFDLGRTTEHGYVSADTPKYALPVIRMNYGMGVDVLSAAIG